MSALDGFSPATRQWFEGAFAAPTAAQEGAWAAAQHGRNALVVAPTGSGKTLAAFLWALDRLAAEPAPEEPRHRCRVLYVSPLKALAVDVQRNLRSPLTGIRQAAQRLGDPVPDITVGMRTGDTPADERRQFARTPPDVLVTTPESLFLLLTSAARESLRGVSTVILDEVHAVAGTKRGAHLALSLERLEEITSASPQRIGLSATVRPVDEVSTFLSGTRPVQVVQPSTPKTITVEVQVPVPDLAALDERPAPGSTDEEVVGSAAGTAQRPSIWPAVEERLLDLVRSHRSTIVFSNSRRLAERLTSRLNELAAEQAAAEEGAASADDGPAGNPAFPAEAVGQSGVGGGAAPTVARAHHGSMSRDQRTLVEEELKSGLLPCVVATSSLELGIDMGAVDLVVQVEAPPSVASGLQRVGRAGHQVGAVSEGVVFPKFRGDLVSCAVVAERMTTGSIESTRYPRNPLDVLAQQIVAMVAMEPWALSDLAATVRRAAPFAALPDSALHAVLDMLAGRYPSEEFGELRARITWDRVTDELRGRPGAQRLAVTSGGTIPDRGLFTVMTPGGADGAGSRVGELDEEMVYESRVGDTFLLGTSSWRVEDITHDRVIVTPAPGVPARMPFWKGESIGRPLELGRAVGAFVREMSGLTEQAARERAAAAGLDEWARDNLLSYLREQREATRHVPSDRTILVERFRDELGDWRLVVHSPFGAQVNGPWALAIAARMRERRGVEVSASGADDGIVLRLPDAVDESGSEVVPGAEDVLLEPGEIEQIVVAELGGSALYASRFRECAARALLLPRRDPRRRSPLWQQRQRSAQLLSVAGKFEQFPITLEAMRECVQDVYDLPGLRELMGDIGSRKVSVAEIETSQPSPFARSLLFGYVGMFLYEADAPLAERRAAALSLDSTLLSELLGSEAIRELLDPEVLTEVEAALQRTAPDRHARDVEGAADLLRFVGDLSADNGRARGVDPGWFAELEGARRALRVRIAGEERFIAIEDAGRIRDALGAALPVGVPEAFTEPVADPVGDLVLRYARTHGPFTAGECAARFGLGVAVVAGVLDRLTGTGRLVKGELRPQASVPAGVRSETEYCDAEVLRRLRRASLAKLRHEVEPVEPRALGRFLPAWQGVQVRSGSERRGRVRRAPGAEDVLGVVEQLAGAPLPASAVESLILPARLPGYTPALLDELTAAGEVTWAGCGALAGQDGWLALAPTDVADLLLPAPDLDQAGTPLHAAVLSALGLSDPAALTDPDLAAAQGGGALFFRELATRTGQALTGQGEDAPSDDDMVAALWDLVWAGALTNDTLGPLRARLSGSGNRRGAAGRSGAAHRTARRAPRGRYAQLRAGRPSMPSRAGPPSVGGRWSVAVAREADPTRRAHAAAESFLERHGVLTRGALGTERVTGGFAGVYKVLRAMEESGRCRRGYIVEGLGAAQFAVPGAIDRVRALAASGGGGGPAADTGGGSRDEIPEDLLRSGAFAGAGRYDEFDGGAGARSSPVQDAWRSLSRVVLAAADPAQPYGAALAWPDTAGDTRHRPGRKAGALVALVDGVPALYVERGGRSLLSFTTERDELRAAAEVLAGAVHEGWLGSLAVERADGQDSLASELSEVLTEAGFRVTPKGLRLRA
ncbi:MULTISPECIES: ATP-dependent helicase [Pseudonocardia]|uniref:DEAD/DEAH box helicase n=2 Tax=Pseudonocardia TaxID=1847 RepID=A0ABQ0RU89_9PSEU|nr:MULTISPECIES: ATP-dependent helicase [Pseudonocardia]OSY41332.1 putative ATP-dependent helicase Lhr [Pseudonocardia autotrophica]TDN76788.1 Lhr family ATP dependent helicase [Pseudonocardia autotrophica]BBG00789.1 DEAD/DEAH box helicase [Pseudonocardia autotrophica]GEC24245.1 DEAD/DEAH box helicase [Pseudonocardia saturnea]